MDEKTIARIKKLQALAERGVGGEIAFMAEGIDKRTRAVMIEESEAVNEKP